MPLQNPISRSQLDVVPGALLNALGFQKLAVLPEESQLVLQLLFQIANCPFDFFRRDDIMRGRIDGRVGRENL